jgi:hypothetical protein
LAEKIFTIDDARNIVIKIKLLDGLTKNTIDNYEKLFNDFDRCFGEKTDVTSLTSIPGFPDYLTDCINGKVFSQLSNRYLLQDAKGTGDRDENGEGRYFMTSLRDSEGNGHHIYLSVIIMSSYMGIKRSD